MSTFITFCLAIYKAVYVCVFVHVWRNGQFLPRDVMRISAVLDVGRCLSVCPSVTFVNCIQSATDRLPSNFFLIMLDMVVPSSFLRLCPIPKRNPLGGVKYTGMENRVRGPSRSLEMSPFDRAHAISY